MPNKLFNNSILRQLALNMLLRSAVIIVVFSFSETSRGCSSLKAGPMILDVIGCKQFDPVKTFDTSLDKYRFINDLDANLKKKFVVSYTGLVIKGRVANSRIKASGLTAKTGALQGEEIYVYAPPPAQCASVQAKRIATNLKEICCNGSVDAPCLTRTTYEIQDIKPLGKAMPSKKAQLTNKMTKSKEYLAGTKAFRQGKFLQASKWFEATRRQGILDNQGHYLLALSYRKQDRCRSSLEILKILNQRSKKSKLTEDEKVFRDARFLEARCFSKINNPSAAIVILDGYLLDRKKYRKEIIQALKHPDFGWIHASKEYQTWKKEAGGR